MLKKTFLCPFLALLCPRSIFVSKRLWNVFTSNIPNRKYIFVCKMIIIVKCVSISYCFLMFKNMQKSQRKCQERRNKRRDEMSGLYKKFKHKSNYHTHKKEFHEKLSRKNKSAVCEMCKNIFSSWSSLKRHRINFHEKK